MLLYNYNFQDLLIWTKKQTTFDLPHDRSSFPQRMEITPVMQGKTRNSPFEETSTTTCILLTLILTGPFNFSLTEVWRSSSLELAWIHSHLSYFVLVQSQNDGFHSQQSTTDLHSAFIKDANVPIKITMCKDSIFFFFRSRVEEDHEHFGHWSCDLTSLGVR